MGQRQRYHSRLKLAVAHLDVASGRQFVGEKDIVAVEFNMPMNDLIDLDRCDGGTTDHQDALTRRLQFPILYWDETTAAQPFETGIQRVVRRLGHALVRDGYDIVPVGFDTTRRLMRRRFLPSQSFKGAVSDPYDFTKYNGAWLFIPEIPMDALCNKINPVDLGRAYGLRTVALVHDLIPIRLAHDYDQDVFKRYERYYRMFAGADLVFATTDYVARDLREYLQAQALLVPNIVVHPLPAQFADMDRRHCKTRSVSPASPFKLLTTSTWEPRKNLPRLLRSITRAQKRISREIELTVVGKRGGFPAYIAEVDALLSEMPNVVAVEHVSDEMLATLYDSHHASIYPSIEEGFGMPILESLWLATPCICHNASSMAEITPGGGTMAIDMTNEEAICDALCRLTKGVGLLPHLAAEIAVRPLKTWADYGRAIASSLGRQSNQSIDAA